MNLKDAPKLMVQKALVCGAGGFIGGHLVKRLKRESFWVRGADIKTRELQRVKPTNSSLAICAILTSFAT